MIAPISEDEFRLFRDLIHRECGLYFGDNKRTYLSSRIGKRLAATSIGSFYRYYRYLTKGGVENERELLRLLDVLTINETAFFRNRPQFDFLEQRVIPEILDRKRSVDPRLRIWSAGCATGEEPYSIAISALETIPEASGWEIRVYASDLSLTALETAAAGVYSQEKLAGISPGRLRRYFERCDEGFRVRDELKRVVIYDFHNLKHDNGLGGLDVVFCRNVLIYFDPAEQKRVVDKLVRGLRPGGYLLLGHSESVQGLSSEIKFVHHGRGTGYQKVVES
ncbi:MAG TPA: protein-glutamate O-methyltransferase CheR [Vicinamibacteria bacterium]|nr:protein-glutamate O-methyltransferase CheR [Vicinamibacteria bacterium]